MELYIVTIKLPARWRPTQLGRTLLSDFPGDLSSVTGGRRFANHASSFAAASSSSCSGLQLYFFRSPAMDSSHIH